MASGAAGQKRPASSLEEEMSRFEAEISGLASPSTKQARTDKGPTNGPVRPPGPPMPPSGMPVPPSGPNPFTGPMPGPRPPGPPGPPPMVGPMPGPALTMGMGGFSHPGFPGMQPGPQMYGQMPQMQPQMQPWMNPMGNMPMQQPIQQPPKPPTAAPAPSAASPAPAESAPKEEEQKPKKGEKKFVDKKLVRHAAGETWVDETLAEWDDNDFRIFVGDLGNDCTDDMLTRIFSIYPSFKKAKVIRDKRTSKSKGFGFVSLTDSKDFVRAMKEMNGKYCGNRPMKLRKSSWEDRRLDVKKKKGEFLRV